MPIFRRFLLAFGLIITIGAIQGTTTYFSVRSLSADLASATLVPMERVDAAWRAWDAFREADDFLIHALEGIRDADSSDLVGRFYQLSQLARTQLARLVDSGGESVDPQRLERDVVATFEGWQAAGLVLLGKGTPLSIPAPHVMEHRGRLIRSNLQKLIVASQTQAAAARVKIESQAQRTQVLSVIIASFGIVVGLAIAYPFALALTRPLHLLQRRMLAMVAGDLDAPVSGIDRSDEIGSIAAAVQFMRDRLIERRCMEEEAAGFSREQNELVRHLGHVLDHVAKGDLTIRMSAFEGTRYAKLQSDLNIAIEGIESAVLTVAQSTYELFGGSKAITATTSDLAQRSEQQALRLRAAVAALGDISSAIRGTAVNTKLASDAVSAANFEADRAGDMMRGATDTMVGIEASSGRISSIAATIDGIAHQTSILALNTAIEAARAGEMGRGFAVVAGEVRALATRSAVAADEIKVLIKHASTDMRYGVSLIERIGEVIASIMGRVSSIDDLVANVADAARGQASALEGVVFSVTEADRAIQQNVKIGDSSAVSVQQLHDRTATLAGLVRHFKIRDTAPGDEGGASLLALRS